MTQVRVGIILEWLSKRRFTYLYDSRKSRCACLYDSVRARTHTCMNEEQQVCISVWLQEEMGLHTCMTEEKQIYIRSWLRKISYKYIFNWGKAYIYLFDSGYLYDSGKSVIHTSITEEKQIYILVWIRIVGIHTCRTEEKQISILV